MNKTRRVLITGLGLANVFVYAAAAWLLWYIWPVLIEIPTVVPSAEFVVPVPPPERAVSADMELDEDFFLDPTLLQVTPVTEFVEAAAPPAETPEPTPTPLTLMWPAKEPGSGGAVPSKVPTVSLSPHHVNLLIMGTDHRKGQAHWRTDTLIIVSVNPTESTIRLLSIPRDLWVYIPGYGQERINTADFLGERMGVNKGGADLVKQTIEYNLGIPIHYYVRVNYDAFEKIINTLGGVTVQVDCPLTEIFENSRSPTGWSRFSVKPGIHHMDGWTALLYARVRRATSDFDRHRRQQQIMKGVWQGALAADVIRDGPRLYSILKDSVDTDLTLQNMLALGYVAVRVRPQDIRSYYIGRSMVQSWTTPAGAAVLLPVDTEISKVVKEMFAKSVEAKGEKKVAAEKAKVTILDGIGNPERANLLASQLRWKGLRVIKVESADRSDYARTVVVSYGTHSKPESLNRICQTVGIEPAAVLKEPDPQSTVDFLVIMGRDYDPCQAQ